MSKRHYLLILLGLSLLTRFMFFGQPNETVFDEVHFGKFVSAYYTGEFYFDIHPALGKLLIAGFAKISNFKPEFAFAEIGDKYPNKQYEVLRLLPTLANALLPLVILLLLSEVGVAPLFAFLGGFFVVFDNAILAQGRFILMDSFMLLFGFTSLLFYFKYRKSQTFYPLLATGILSGLALSIKWIALSFIALPLILEGFEMLIMIARERKFYFSKAAKLVSVLGIIPVLIYFSVFMIDFSLLKKSGTGDAFMSPGFQKTLSGSRYENDPNIKASNLLQKFTELNTEMYKANQRLTATHPYSSQWYTWPLMTRPIYYWVDGDARIYLIGNPLIWWGSTLIILFSITYYAVYAKRKYHPDKIYLFLLGGYVLNLLPFIGVKRVMFLYHYLTALIFSILIFAYILNKHSSILFTTRKNSKIVAGVLLVVVVGLFIFFAPLTYGLNLSPKAYGLRVWIDSWK